MCFARWYRKKSWHECCKFMICISHVSKILTTCILFQSAYNLWNVLIQSPAKFQNAEMQISLAAIWTAHVSEFSKNLATPSERAQEEIINEIRYWQWPEVTCPSGIPARSTWFLPEADAYRQHSSSRLCILLPVHDSGKGLIKTCVVCLSRTSISDSHASAGLLLPLPSSSARLILQEI